MTDNASQERPFRWPPKDAATPPTHAPTASPPPAGPAPVGPGDAGAALDAQPPSPASRADPGPPPRGGPWAWVATLERELLGGGPSAVLDGWEPPAVGEFCGRCGGPVGTAEADATGCGSCRGKRLAWDRAVSLGAYDGPLRAGVTACKYHGDRGAGERLARLLGDRTAEAICSTLAPPPGRAVLVVPVPTTLRRRLRNGGLDHSLLLARGVARALETSPTLLLDRRHGPRVAGRSVAARAEAVAGTVRRRSALGVPRATDVVLVDDVRTTGATATACFRVLRTMFGCAPRRGHRRGAGTTGTHGPVFWLATASVSTRRRAPANAPGGQESRSTGHGEG